MAMADFDKLLKYAKDRETARILEEIRKDSHLARKEGKIIKGENILKLRLFDYVFHMYKKGAYSSVDILYENFVEEHHQRIPGFDGKGSSVIVDVGANEGYYAMKMVMNNPKLKIYAFEPNPQAFKLLSKNISENKMENIVASDVAISDVNEDESFQLVDEISAIGGFRIFGYRPWLDVDRIRQIIVKSATLDRALECLDHVDIMKLDVEGAEYKVLKGGGKALSIIDKIVVECHGEKMGKKVSKYLKNKGYSLVYKEKKECGDFYFVKD